jgi:hypothetical protein
VAAAPIEQALGWSDLKDRTGLYLSGANAFYSFEFELSTKYFPLDSLCGYRLVCAVVSKAGLFPKKTRPRSFDLQALQYEVSFFPVSLCVLMKVVEELLRPPYRLFCWLCFRFSRPKRKARPAHKH